MFPLHYVAFELEFEIEFFSVKLKVFFVVGINCKFLLKMFLVHQVPFTFIFQPLIFFIMSENFDLKRPPHMESVSR